MQSAILPAAKSNFKSDSGPLTAKLRRIIKFRKDFSAYFDTDKCRISASFYRAMAPDGPLISFGSDMRVI